MIFENINASKYWLFFQMNKKIRGQWVTSLTRAIITIIKSDLWSHIQKIWSQDHKTYLDWKQNFNPQSPYMFTIRPYLSPPPQIKKPQPFTHGQWISQFRNRKQYAMYIISISHNCESKKENIIKFNAFSLGVHIDPTQGFWTPGTGVMNFPI